MTSSGLHRFPSLWQCLRFTDLSSCTGFSSRLPIYLHQSASSFQYHLLISSYPQHMTMLWKHAVLWWYTAASE